MAAAAGAIDPRIYARFAQGFPNTGSAAAPKTGLFSSLVGAATTIAAKSRAGLAAKAATPVMQGVATGGGFAAGQAAMTPVKGVFGWFADLKPDNLYGGMVIFAVLLYGLDLLVTDFDVARTAWLRMAFGIGGFFILSITGRYLNFWSTIIASVLFYSSYGLLGALQGALTGGFSFQLFSVNTALIAFVLGSGVLYINLPIPNAIKLLPLFMLLETFGLPLARERVLDSVAGIGYLAFAATFVFNRVLFPLPLIYSTLGFYADSRTARKILGLLIIVYLVASLPKIQAAYADSAGLSEEEQKQVKGFLASLRTNVRSIVSGEFIRAPTAAAYEGLERTFGFGEPKDKQPLMGMKLESDPNMPSSFDLGFIQFEKPAASAVMKVPNPFPQDFPLDRKVVRVVEIKCTDTSSEPTTEVNYAKPPHAPDQVENRRLIFSQDKPLYVTFEVPRTIECEFPEMKEGSKTVEIRAVYNFKADSFLETTFMRADEIEPDIGKGRDPAIANFIHPAKAKYDNWPVTLTWGPVELSNPPVGVDIFGAAGQSAVPNTVGIVIYVAKNPAWTGEIGAVRSLALTVPEGVELTEGDGCSFERAGSGTSYKVKDGLITTKDGPRFIGDGIRFKCGMRVSPDVFKKSDEDVKDSAKEGPNAVTRRFDLIGDFDFSTKSSVSFQVTGAASS